jgi:hypothetical protein
MQENYWLEKTECPNSKVDRFPGYLVYQTNTAGIHHGNFLQDKIANVAARLTNRRYPRRSSQTYTTDTPY